MKTPKLICECGGKREMHCGPTGKRYWKCQPCQKIKLIEWRKNRPKISKEWREKNRIKLRIQQKNYRLRHLEKERIRCKEKQLRYQREEPWRIKEWNRKHSQTPKGRFKSYKVQAKSRGIKFEITMDQFMQFWNKECEYCGSPIKTIGIDRIDNKRGYTVDNIGACCEWCNKMKMNHGAKEFIKHCKEVIDYQNA